MASASIAPIKDGAAAAQKKGVAKESIRLILNQQQFSEKGNLVRKDREINARRRIDLPKVVCPVVVEIRNDENATDLDVVPEIIHKEMLPGQKMALYSLAEVDWRPSVGSWKETNDDHTADGDWRKLDLKKAIEGSGNTNSPPNSLLCGPFPIMWLVPDPEFKPRQQVIPMYPSSKLMTFFKLWGKIDNCDCIVQEDHKSMLVVVKYNKRECLIQASLCLYARFLSYQEETFPANLNVVCYKDAMEGMAMRVPGHLGYILKRLNQDQKRVFSQLYTRMEQLERENQALATELHIKYSESQKKLRLSAKPKQQAKKAEDYATEEYHKELLL